VYKHSTAACGRLKAPARNIALKQLLLLLL
jgi:hypothetical protein